MKLYPDYVEVESELEIDQYIPVKVLFSEKRSNAQDLVYYVIRDNRSSYIEFKLNPYMRKIHSIIVVSADDFERKSISYSCEKVVANPLVVFDKDEELTQITKNKICTYVSRDTVTFSWSDDEVWKIISTKYVDFLLDAENNFIGFQVFGISDYDQKVLEDYFEFCKKTRETMLI